MKPNRNKYGYLAPRQAIPTPWYEVHIDTVGNWSIPYKGMKKPMEFKAQTCIEPVTNLLEVVRVKGADSQTAWDAFENNYLARYPKPYKCIHDGGPEFQKHFQTGLLKHGIKSQPITSGTPTANAVIEAVHKSMGVIVRTLVEATKPQNETKADKLADNCVAACMHACRCASNESLGYNSPGALVFNRDMLLNLPIIADIVTLRDLRQAKIDKRVLNANRKRIRHEFAVNDQVYVWTNPVSKARKYWAGPFPIIQVHTNNTVTIRRGNNLIERLSIRRLKPE